MNKNKKTFFALRDPEGPYKFLIGAAKAHSERLFNEKLILNVNKINKLDLVAIFYLIKIIFETNLFSKNKIMSVNYQGYNLSRYTIPEIYRNYKV